MFHYKDNYLIQQVSALQIQIPPASVPMPFVLQYLLLSGKHEMDGSHEHLYVLLPQSG